MNQTTATIETSLWKAGRNNNIEFLSSWCRLEKEAPDLFKIIEQGRVFRAK